jgi:cell division protein FtsA
MRKPLAKPRTGLVAAIDIGSTKVCCFIARSDEASADPSGMHGGMPTARLRIIGIGHHLSLGIRAGAVVDMEQAERSVLAAVNAAEKMAGETLKRVYVNLSSGHPLSDTVDVEVPIGGQEIADQELKRVLGQSGRVELGQDRQLLHAIPTGFSIDGANGIKDPRGMTGERLGARMHMVTAASSTLRNLTSLINRCHLDVEGIVVSPYASGLATLVEDETDLGVALIDLGGGTTTIAVFFDGSVVHSDCLAIGGLHVTKDIAKGLDAPLAAAERLKTYYGHAKLSPLDERDTIEVPIVGEDDASQTNTVSRAMLIRIIQPRLEEILELARSRLEESGCARLAGRRVVLTGGASLIPGLRELAQTVLNKHVRLGRPTRLNGLADAAAGPAFSTCAGLLLYAASPSLDAPRIGAVTRIEPSNLFGKVGSWLRENF